MIEKNIKESNPKEQNFEENSKDRDSKSLVMSSYKGYQKLPHNLSRGKYEWF